MDGEGCNQQRGATLNNYKKLYMTLRVGSNGCGQIVTMKGNNTTEGLVRHAGRRGPVDPSHVKTSSSSLSQPKSHLESNPTDP